MLLYLIQDLILKFRHFRVFFSLAKIDTHAILHQAIQFLTISVSGKYHLNHSVHVSKWGGGETVDLTIEALHPLQEIIYCMFQDKCTTAIQHVPNVQ